MRNILFEHPVCHAPETPTTSSPSLGRRLLSIRIALQLSGAPPPDTASQILLVRYVAGQLSLADIMPTLWQG